MNEFGANDLRKLYIPPAFSHKGQNGKLLVIAGSKLFHAPPIWIFKIASRIVDMVFYSSIEENNKIIQKIKEEFRDGIVVPRNKIDNYIKEADCVLIGPGLPRKDGEQEGDNNTKILTETLLKKYPHKKWVIDGGSLQTIDPKFIPKNAILTPHPKELEMLKLVQHDKGIGEMAKKYNCIILLKGPTDIVCSPKECLRISGGNAGMTKGGTGDVLAGLVASLYCKNDEPFLVALAGSYINKKAGESLFKKVGYYFNASDLADEIPRIMKKLPNSFLI